MPQLLYCGGNASSFRPTTATGADRAGNHRSLVHGHGGANCSQGHPCRVYAARTRPYAHYFRAKAYRARAGSERSFCHRKVRRLRRRNRRLYRGMALGGTYSGRGPCLARAVRVLWETAYDLVQLQQRQEDAATWLGVLAFPALIVDKDLHVHEVNGSAQSLMAKGELLKANGDRLAGRSSSVTVALREAIRESLSSRADREWLDTTVPLSTERERFAFARIGAAPPPCDPGKALVIVPQFDEVSGAHRIAAAFGLNFAEERIVTRILQGKCPRKIGADLRLTEATVRTYTKRIMLKLGINRQSEFFVLHHLTQSPFGSGLREKSVRGLGSASRLSG